MKKYFLISVNCIAVLLVAAAGPASRAVAEEKPDPNRPASVDAVGTEWSRYSWGLYYKNLALVDRKAPERNEYLKKAIDYFNEAGASGAALDRVYYQLSDCYFYLRDFDASLDYARRSLTVNSGDLHPYNRIYNIYLKLRKFDEAAEILEEYLKIKPESVQSRFILAEHYYRNMRELDRAAAAYKKVIEMSERQPIEDYYKEQSWITLANIAYQKGEPEQAVAMYQEALKINKDNLDVIYYLALTCMEMYDLPGAERYSHLFLEKRPGEQTIMSVLGRIYYLRDDIRAVSHLGRAKNTGSVSGILAWGLYCELLRYDEKAEKLLNSVLKFAPRTISLHMALARIHQRKGDISAAFNEYVTTGVLMYNGKLYEEARRSLTEAARLNNGIPGVYYYLAKTHEDSQHLSLALYNYIRANGLQPEIDLMIHIGYLYGVKKDYARAIGYFNRASAKEPKNSKPYFFKGLISLWQEDYSTAERHIQRAILLDEKKETYYFYHAIVMEKMSKLNRAIKSLEKAIRHNPESARSYNYLGYLYADNNMKIDESLGLILKALELEPGNGAYTDSLGWAYYRKGDLKRALESLLAAEEILRKENSPDPVVYDHIGDTYLKLGRIVDALKYWNKSNEMKKSASVESKIKKFGNKQ